MNIKVDENNIKNVKRLVKKFNMNVKGLVNLVLRNFADDDILMFLKREIEKDYFVSDEDDYLEELEIETEDNIESEIEE